MAEGAAAQAPPTFKLVLVGDGGTGKVMLTLRAAACPAAGQRRSLSLSRRSTNSANDEIT